MLAYNLACALLSGSGERSGGLRPRNLGLDFLLRGLSCQPEMGQVGKGGLGAMRVCVARVGYSCWKCKASDSSSITPCVTATQCGYVPGLAPICRQQPVWEWEKGSEGPCR